VPCTPRKEGGKEEDGNNWEDAGEHDKKPGGDFGGGLEGEGDGRVGEGEGACVGYRPDGSGAGEYYGAEYYGPVERIDNT